MSIKAKTSIVSAIKFNGYRIVSDAVEDGVHVGYHRAHKHTDTPDEELMKSAIFDAVMNELSEVLIWSDDAEEVG